LPAAFSPRPLRPTFPLSTLAILSTVVWDIVTVFSRVAQGIRSKIADSRT
jgi:hypothetical protein